MISIIKQAAIHALVVSLTMVCRNMLTTKNNNIAVETYIKSVNLAQTHALRHVSSASCLPVRDIIKEMIVAIFAM